MSCFKCFKKTGNEYKIPVRPSVSDRTTRQRPDKECFFVITAIFNPASFQKRYDLYNNFSEHMYNTGAQLITIECIFPSLGQQEFQVTDSNNPNHIQVKSESVYWVKENLINIAVSRLPAHAKWVCWLDGDILFHERNWIDQTLEALTKYTVVQMFETANFLGPHNEVLRSDYSFGYSVVHRKPIDQLRYHEWYPHPGYGWAMEKNTFLRINGLPDYDIVGSGDLHFAFSLLNRISNAVEKNLNPEFKSMILEKSKETYLKLVNVSKSQKKSMVGYVPVTISHQWHGSRKNRQYVDRWKILIAHNFNYWTDVTKTSDGLLILKDTRRQTYQAKPSLQADIQVHFEMRNEDDGEIDPEDKIWDKQITPNIQKPRPHSKSSPKPSKNPFKSKHDPFVKTRGKFKPDDKPMYAIGVYDPNLPYPDYLDNNDDNQGNESDHCNDDHQSFSHGNTDSGVCQESDSYAHGHDSYANDYNGTITCSSQY